ncbi:LacI family transcriptional regulator [Subtercola sp. Z020]|uniref:LacI family DNA-binding transcriptional regulator n=1 Tax=Subtercola sp. Z020 TaxID=2080582 RepID=UPI000CE85C3D|nr:LacI family DNA-binding transcriptional regulator [Subtercola sp. Z020]PPF77510.1 LacI family transcriptional regulator [Subtercola sp. Z020]
MGRITLKDVSEHAGVSRSTASLVLNDDPSIPEVTKKRVRASMLELGYVYNRQAATLRSQKSMALGLVVTEIRNEYFAELAMSLEGAAYEAGYTLLLCYSRDDLRRQETQIERLFERGVDGLVLLPAAETEPAKMDLLLRGSQVPFVLLARHFGLEHDYVGADNIRAGELLGAHISSLGARSVSILGGPASTSAGLERIDGFTRSVSGAGIEVVPEQRITSHTNASDGARATARLLDGGTLPDVIVAYSDVIAVGVYAELHARGLRPGTDIAVAAFDDIPGSEHQVPPLTTVATFPSAIGLACGELLLRRIAEGVPESYSHTLIEPQLRIRASTVSWRPRHG